RPSTQLPSAVGVAFKPSVGVSFFFVAPAATVICTLSLHDALPISWIITNPPFRDSVAFINRAIQIGKPFAYLLKSQYWHARNKTELFNKFRPKYVLALNWRPDFHFGKKGGSPTMECLWVVWDSRPSETTEYHILSKPI